MLYTNEEGITYDDGIDLRFKELPIKEFQGAWCNMTLGSLKQWLEKYAVDLPDSTPILYDNISEQLLLDKTGWTVTPMVWEKHEYEGETYTQYQPCIHAWQVYRSTDKNGDVGLVFTAHY